MYFTTMWAGNPDTFVDTCLANYRASSSPTLVINARKTSWTSFMENFKSAQFGLFDFDGTIETDSQWRIFRKLITSELHAEEIAQLTAYINFEKERKLAGRGPDVEIERDLVRLPIMRRVQCHVTREQLQQVATQYMNPRDGAIELWRSFQPKKKAVVSYGVADMIRPWLHAIDGHNGFTTTVKAAELVWDGDSRLSEMVGYDEDSIVIEANKQEKAEEWMNEVGGTAEKTVAFGDNVTDRGLFKAARTSVFVIPRSPDTEPHREEHRYEGIKECFVDVDVFWVGDSLTQLAKLRKAVR